MSEPRPVRGSRPVGWVALWWPARMRLALNPVFSHALFQRQFCWRHEACSGARGTLLVLAGGLAAMVGCASPGRPLPPSLQVPRLETGLSAERVGNTVRLRWTTPERTTDGVTVEGTMTTEICRSTRLEAQPVAAKPSGGGGRGVSSGSAKGVPGTCDVVARMAVKPGPSEAVDRLPNGLAAGKPALLVYQVQLRGETGKTAGPGPAAYTATGSAPAPLAGWRATDEKAGAVLEWKPDAALDGQSVEIERTVVAAVSSETVSQQAVKPPAEPRSTLPGRLGGKGRAPESGQESGTARVVRLTAGAGDSGGVVDRTVEVGREYRYTAERVLRILLGGQEVALHSEPTLPAAVTIRGDFAPEPPVELAVAPSPGSIDLSWEPGAEPRAGFEAAGYRIYRRAEGETGWRLLTPQPVATPGFRDNSVVGGRRYAYRVTALSAAGLESAPCRDAAATAE